MLVFEASLVSFNCRFLFSVLILLKSSRFCVKSHVSVRIIQFDVALDEPNSLIYLVGSQGTFCRRELS